MPRDVHKSLELLEEYHAELFRPSDNELKFCIERVIGLFKTNLFSALCEIQEFYDNILLNPNISLGQKVYETRRFAERWEKGPVRPFGIGAPMITSVLQPIVPSNSPLASSLAKSRQVNRLIDEFGYEWEVEEVVVDASQVGLGFSISGGRDREPEPDHYIRITDISPGGAIAANGRLRVGDVILRVNDVDCSNVEHQVAVSALQRAGTFVRLLVKRLKVQRSQSQPRLNEVVHPPQQHQFEQLERQRALSGSAVDASKLRQFIQPQKKQPVMFSPHQSRAVSRLSANSNVNTAGYNAQTLPAGNVSKAPRLVTLFKGDAGLGFNIVGGEDNEPIYISHVLPGGAADITGNVRKGDVLLRVNDMSLQNATHAEAAYVLKSVPSNSYVSLLLQYRPREYHEFEDKVIRLQNDLRFQQQQFQTQYPPQQQQFEYK